VKAALVTEWGGPDRVVVRDVPDPRPGAGEVVVGVRAAAVNHPDLLLAANRYQVSVPVPFTPGSEFAGEVLEVGPDVDAVRPGDHVTGVAMTGAFAERVVVPATALRPRPAELDWHSAAAFAVTYHTAYQALVPFGRVRPGCWAVALGATGGVGTATIHLARRLGARVVAVTSSPERAQFALEQGADAVIDRTAEPVKDRLKALVPAGVDIVVDPAGGDCSEQALRAVRWGGRFVVVGFASGAIARLPLNLVLLKGVHVCGFELRTLAWHAPHLPVEAERALGALVHDGLRPTIGAVYPLADVRRALEHAAAGRALGKIVIDVS
jgi:NADPH2:quinone reductase